MIHETTTPQSPALPVTRSYVWGLDLSQTLQGAGGVGGLLCSVHSPQGGSAATYYATADANGNITDYIDESGAVSASFTYDAFGQVVSESIAQGLEPNAFPHRFSSKYWDSETDLSYYGFRYYSADKAGAGTGGGNRPRYNWSLVPIWECGRGRGRARDGDYVKASWSIEGVKCGTRTFKIAK